MTGRKVVPINVKKARGTYRKDRDKNAPKPSVSKPSPPSWLNKRAKQIFHLMVKRLSQIGLDSSTYTEAIALLASRMEEVERFDKMLNEDKENGYVYKTTNSFGDPILKEHPAVRLREKAARHVHSLLTEFGLTGASAQKVGSTPKDGDKKNEFDEY